MKAQQQVPGPERTPPDAGADADVAPEIDAAPKSNAEMQARVAALRSGGAGLGERIPVTAALLSLLGPNAGAPPPSVSANPAVKSGHDYPYRAFTGPRWARGAGDANDVDPSDVDQGALGDCYLHAAMAAIARANPDAIRRLIRDNGDGTYDVTLHLDVDGDWKPWAVDHVERVTSTFPADAEGTPAYAGNSRSADGAELWVMLIEKAYAQARGGYGAIEGGDPGAAMEVLGWSGFRTIQTADTSEARLGEVIEAAFTQHKPVTAATPDFAKKDKALRDAADAADIHGNHAYAIMRIDRKAGTIDLQNPWSIGSAKRGVAISTFKRLFSFVEIGD